MLNCSISSKLLSQCAEWMSAPQVNHIPRIMKHALQSTELEEDYQECWAGLKSHFKGPNGKDAKPAPYSNGDSHIV